MARASRLSRAGLLVAAFAVACGTDTIDLLPTGTGGTTLAAAGNTPGGSELGGSASEAGTSGTSGASAGSSGSHLGGSGGTGGCSGFGCGGFGNTAGFGGDDGECDDLFCPCGPQGRCGYELKCNQRLGMCTLRCDSPLECGEGLLCENNSCATCSEDEQCKEFGGFGRRVCVDDRCEECKGPSDCPQDSPMCIARRCIQCLTNEDCPGKSCDKARGRCEK